MDPEEYDIMYQAEDALWWYKGMEAITRAVLDRYYRRGTELQILDAGCGTCGSVAYLSDYGAVTGMDISPWALQLGIRRGNHLLVRGTVSCLPFAAASFDVVTSFDVLCVRSVDSEAALNEFRRVLRPGGRVLLRLPAYNWLRGAHDRAVDIGQRYTAPDIAGRVRRAGFLVEHLSYANMWLLPLAIAKRWAERLLPRQQRSDLTIDVGSLNRLFRWILSSEAPIVARRGLPFGLTVVTVARRA